MKLSPKTRPKIARPKSGVKNSKTYDWDLAALVFEREEPRREKAKE